MSWGERSCKEYGDCGISSMSKCNTECVNYRHNGKIPDSPKVKFTVGNLGKVWGYRTKEGYKTIGALPK
jgi:hypothetical protein